MPIVCKTSDPIWNQSVFSIYIVDH